MPPVDSLNISNIALEPHMRFICPECGEEHATQKEWRRHLNEFHEYTKKSSADFDFKMIDERYHECLICHKWVANARNAIALLQYHRFLHLPYNRTYSCRYCTGAFTRKRALCEHLERYHARQIIRLQQMRKTGGTAVESALKDPRKNPEFYLRFICPQCDKQMDWFHEWLEHLDKAHITTSSNLRMHPVSGSQNFYCLECKRLVCNADKEKLQRHSFTHMPHKLYFKCAFCSVKKTLKGDILRHFLHVHQYERIAAKPYLKKPVEWGHNANSTKPSESETQLGINMNDANAVSACTTKKGPSKTATTNGPQKHNDIIQRALKDIDLKVETMHEMKPLLVNNSAKEHALDQSLNDLETILRDDLQTHQSQHTKQLQQYEEDLLGSDLEQLCEDVFEEIKAKDPLTLNGTLSMVTKVRDEPEQDKLISIEIDAVDEGAELQEPNHKHLKLKATQNSKRKLESPEKSNEKLLERFIKYLCPSCGEEFLQQSDWRQHFFSLHDLVNVAQVHFRTLDTNSYLCLECMNVINTTKVCELQRHHFMHMRFQSYLKCIFCGCTKSNKPKILHHLEKFHAEVLPLNPTVAATYKHYECQQCGKEFYTQARFQHHHSRCEQRDAAIAGGAALHSSTKLYNSEENMRLLAHLRKARERIRKLHIAGLAACEQSI